MSSKTDTWMPIYWGDYYKDTQLLKAEAHGAYFLLMGHCWSNGGYAPDNITDLLYLCRLEHLTNAEQVLEQVLKFFIKKDGKIFNKRLLKEKKKSQENLKKKSEAGKMSGISRRKKANTCSTSVQTKREQNANPSPSPKEERVKKDYKDKPYNLVRFEDFWILYPRKSAKKDAMRAYEKAMKNKVAHETIIKGLLKYAESVKNSDKRHICLPATWLNAERWMDEDFINPNGEQHGKQFTSAIDYVADLDRRGL